MKDKVQIIFPDQLYENTSHLDKESLVYLVEHPLYFRDKEKEIYFHKQKLILHRASMKYYEDFLKQSGYEVKYIEYSELEDKKVFKILKEDIKKVTLTDPTNRSLLSKLRQNAKQLDIKLKVIDSPNFVTKIDEIQQYFSDNKYNQTSFYIWQRKRLNILVDENGNPEGGDWTYDTKNRKKLPKDIEMPEIKQFKDRKKWQDAIEYVEENFPDHPGKIKGDFQYPHNHDQAESLLNDFIKNKLRKFGDYQDAITKKDHPLLFHSGLSSSINIGLLDPMQVAEAVIEAYKNQEIELNNLEGFIRQIIGWREFMRAVYVLEGESIVKNNFWKHKKKLPESYWNGKTGITPFDDCIKKVNKNAYLHHIERLMIAGNFMLLNHIDPDEVYKWFMTLFIDAYEWVMVPNVYCMSQYASGGIITTKPYISGSNYIRKMSDYGKDDWAEKWDKLFWDFIEDNLEYFRSNPRMRVLTSRFNK